MSGEEPTTEPTPTDTTPVALPEASGATATEESTVEKTEKPIVDESTVEEPPAAQPATKKAVAKKPVTKKAAARKSAPKKAAKTTAKKSAPKKKTAEKAAPVKAAPTKAATPKKSTVPRSTSTNGSSAKHSAPEHFDVLIIGAGLSGIGAAYHLQSESPWATYAILESRDAMGGTWDLFRYPGIRSDSDMFTLSYEFKPWKGPKSVSDGDSIRTYIEETAREAGIDEHIRYGHKVLAENWSSDESRWHVTVERSDGTTVELTANFIISCTGYYSYESGYVPDFEGMDDYEGQIVHPQFWPEDLDYEDKTVIVIGSGATAITVVPSMAPLAKKVTMLQRSPTYLLTLPTRNPLADVARKVLPTAVSGPLIRWGMATGTLSLYKLSRSAPGVVRNVLLRGVRRQLPKGYDVEKHFTPHYQPWDERICVVTDGDLFKGVSSGKIEMVTDHIERFTTKGIELKSGRELEADIIVPATGLDVLFLGGAELSVDGEKVVPGERMAYKGTMLEGVPNMTVMFGYANASWTLKADLSAGFTTRLLNHMREHGHDFAVPEAMEDAGEHKPLLGLASGYVQRSIDRLPKQGSKFPWQVHQSYFKDYRLIKMRSVEDEGIRFGRSTVADQGSDRSSEPRDEDSDKVSVGASV